MVFSLRLLLGILLVYAGTCAAQFSGSAMEGMDEAAAIQREQIERMRDFLGPRAEEVGRAMAKREAPISFSNPRAREFFVDGTTIPDGECKLRLGRGIERVLMVIAQ